MEGKAEVLAVRDPDSHPMGYSIDWLPDGRLLVTGDKLRRQEPDGSMVVHVDQRANEIVVDARGNIYLNGADFGFVAGAPPKPGYIKLVTRDGQLRQVADDIQFPNGMVITPDDRMLVISESFSGTLTAFDIDAGGGLSNRRVFADGVGPDGITLESIVGLARDGDRHDGPACHDQRLIGKAQVAVPAIKYQVTARDSLAGLDWQREAISFAAADGKGRQFIPAREAQRGAPADRGRHVPDQPVAIGRCDERGPVVHAVVGGWSGALLRAGCCQRRGEGLEFGDELVELGRGQDVVGRCREVVGAGLDPLPGLASGVGDPAGVVDEPTVAHPVGHSCQRCGGEVVEPAELLRGHALGHRIQRVGLEPANAL
jgi:hypothetical protein